MRHSLAESVGNALEFLTTADVDERRDDDSLRNEATFSCVLPRPAEFFRPSFLRYIGYSTSHGRRARVVRAACFVSPSLRLSWRGLSRLITRLSDALIWTHQGRQR